MPEGVDAGPDSLGPLMDAQVPAVVAVIVTTDPGPWLEEALSSLAAQDYEETFRPGPVGRGGRSARSPSGWPASSPTPSCGTCRAGPATPPPPTRPSAWWRAPPSSCSCTTTSRSTPMRCTSWSRSRSAPTPGSCRPKFVNWDDPRVLLHVGMSCDKTGAVVDRIIEGEVDHGQHDAVRDVFVAPGGCILVRADLFAELEGLRRRDRRHGRGPRPLVAQPGRGLARRGRPRRPGAPPRGGRQRARAAGGGGRARRSPPRHPAVAAAAPRAARRAQVLHPAAPLAGPAAGGAAGLRRGARRRAGPRPRPGPGRHRGLALELPPADRDLGAAGRAGRTPALPRRRGAPAAGAGERAALALLQPPLSPGPRSGQRGRRHRERPERGARAGGRRWPSSPAAWARPSARTPTSTTSTTWAGAPDGTASAAGSARRP